MTLGRSSLWAAAVCWVFISLIAGCAVPPAATGDSKDLVTASDETAASKRARTRMELATAYFSRGQLTTALDEVKQALIASPNLGEAYNLRGLIYAGLGDDTLAQESFNRALQINPSDGDTMHNYGWYLCQRREYVEAEALFQRAIALPQYFGTARTLLTSGICQARAGKWAEAELTLTKAYERDPSNPATAINLAEVLLQRGEPERARFYVRRVNAVANQSTAQTLWLAARIEMKLGNRQAANEYGLQLRNRFPQSRESSAFDRGLFNE
jgi:type IV pilus assembly protein PilF